ncbi:hypothetical protein COLO4_22849 [Corchorus olitorius]|uniref:Protein DA1-like domain-containing protein n=1 Tax=Corchorus olitorius TaxID=93759 RepID=A0A1R3IJH9_9ROSI|nr:hypothetical protein COLO4_22849 [Corchorus olitorius]
MPNLFTMDTWQQYHEADEYDEDQSGKGWDWSSQSHQISCDVCRKSITRLEQRRQERFWNQCFCVEHRSDGTPECFSCRRLEGANAAEFLKLDDNRKICQDCFEFRGRCPIFLVDSTEMSRLSSLLGHGDGHGDGYGPQAGLTMYYPKPKIYVENVKSLSRRGNKIEVKVERETYKLYPPFTAVFILFGLPRAMMGSILAHELTHAWFMQTGVRHMKTKTEEGICQVIAHEFLRWFEAPEWEASSSNGNFSREPNSLSSGSKQAFDNWGYQALDYAIEDGTLPQEPNPLLSGSNWAFDNWGYRALDYAMDNGTLPHEPNPISCVIS